MPATRIRCTATGLGPEFGSPGLRSCARAAPQACTGRAQLHDLHRASEAHRDSVPCGHTASHIVGRGAWLLAVRPANAVAASGRRFGHGPALPIRPECGVASNRIPSCACSSTQGDVNRLLLYRERRDAPACPARLTLPDAVAIFGSACLWGLMMRADGPNCRFCAAPLVHEVVDLGMSPPCESFLAASELDQAEAFHPLRVLVCDQCWLVQLREYVSAEEIFGRNMPTSRPMPPAGSSMRGATAWPCANGSG